MESLGNRLKLIRAGLRWSQTESARKIGIEQSYLSKLENDQALPSAGCLESICRVYGVDTLQLLCELDEQLLRRKPELLALQQSACAKQPTGRARILAVGGTLGLVSLLLVTWVVLAIGKKRPEGEMPAPEHELLSMKLEQLEGRKAIELFAEYGGLKVTGLELVKGDIDYLALDQVPWDVALTRVAEELHVRAKISGGYVTLVPLSPESARLPE